MVTTVIVAVDGSEMAERALRYTLETHPDAAVTALTVVGEPSAMFGTATAIALADDPEESASEYAEPVFERVAEIAAEYDTEVETAVAVGHPARSILERAENVDLVVVGSHGGGLADRLLVGNTAERVVRRSPVPVTVVR